MIPGRGTKVLQAAKCSQKKGGQGKRVKNRLGNLERRGKIRMTREENRNERREEIW